MLELRRVVFFVDIGDNLLEKAKASQECREECKNLFISLGFQVGYRLQRKKPKFLYSIRISCKRVLCCKGRGTFADKGFGDIG